MKSKIHQSWDFINHTIPGTIPSKIPWKSPAGWGPPVISWFINPINHSYL